MMKSIAELRAEQVAIARQIHEIESAEVQAANHGKIGKCFRWSDQKQIRRWLKIQRPDGNNLVAVLIIFEGDRLTIDTAKELWYGSYDDMFSEISPETFAKEVDAVIQSVRRVAL